VGSGSRPEANEITRLLHEAGRGDSHAAEDLLPLVYQQLRASAAKKLAGERAGHTLQATALVHEAYLRLVGESDPGWENRRHFYAAAAEAMRRILIEHARARGRKKRGGGWHRLSLESLVLGREAPPYEDIMSVDAAIRRLEDRDPRLATIVRLRGFAGLGPREIALSLGVTDRTIRREWAVARAWLYRALSADDATGSE